MGYVQTVTAWRWWQLTMCKQGQAVLGWWWLVASVPRRPTAGHPHGMNAKVKTGAAWWRRWRSCTPSASGKWPAQIDSRALREKAAAARQERSVVMEAMAQRGGRCHGGSQTQTQTRVTGFTLRITESERNHISRGLEGKMPAAEWLGLPDAAVWAAERLGCTAAAQKQLKSEANSPKVYTSWRSILQNGIHKVDNLITRTTGEKRSQWYNKKIFQFTSSM